MKTMPYSGSMPLTLYVATTNPGKIRDFAAAAQACAAAVEFVSLPGIDNIPPPPEDASTFEENARSKAIAYSLHSPGYIVLADDSGLEVEVLDGAPGVRSARYAADAGFNPDPRSALSTDERNNILLLENLLGVPTGQRIARYRCALAIAQDGKCIAAARGSVEGILLDSPRGSGGFGYDPLFYLPDLDRTMAQISLEEKLPISHRGHALRALIEKLSM